MIAMVITITMIASRNTAATDPTPTPITAVININVCGKVHTSHRGWPIAG